MTQSIDAKLMDFAKKIVLLAAMAAGFYVGSVVGQSTTQGFVERLVRSPVFTRALNVVPGLSLIHI